MGMGRTSFSSRARTRDSRLMVPQATPCLATNISIKTRHRRHLSTRPTTPRASRTSHSPASKGLNPRPCPTGNSSHHRSTRRTAPRSRPHPRPTTHRKLTTPLLMPVRPRHNGSLHITDMGLQTLAMEVLLRHLTPRHRTGTLPALHLRRLSDNQPTPRPITGATHSLLRALWYLGSAPRRRQPHMIQLSLSGRNLRTEAPLGSSTRKHHILQRPIYPLGLMETTVTRYTIETRGPTHRPRPWHRLQCSRRRHQAYNDTPPTHPCPDGHLSKR